jgi:hypothetical protein
MFDILKTELLNFSKSNLTKESVYLEDETYNKNYCFWESYFSNYIEGTKFAPKEALEIVEKGDLYDNTKDSHNVLDHYKFIRKFYEIISTK